ncbi:Crp/Fnr family transcriptional regulator [Lysinibacillus sphaericus]|uniref:Anaerobic regulatory protein n=1 Tax=Lysinibacillus sphaericus TaxID=1421 RepID=A0A2S5D4H9_LYSSH|nr:Crp/Fnr family transcriptional regulator [Lysinibacillus sphaericus]OEC02850.1 Crp/Fnr family transcriptional regulator [Lysinibacillus sphaericus]POZ57984.1 Anaerobic regulatory protein [Lysinibacillus sphaericus]
MVLKDSTQEKIKALFQNNGVFIKVNKDSKIFLEGERAKEIYYIKTGAISISQETESGKELTVRICGPDSIIGEGSLFCNLTYFSMTAKVLESSTLYVLSRKSLEHLLVEQPQLMVEYMKWLQTENLKYQSRLRDLVLNGKKGALFSTLIRLTNTYGKPLEDGSIFIDFPLTNSEIANLCATSREMINRMLNDLKKHHILSFEKGYITIIDLQYLKDEIACENCPLQICRID